MKRIKSELMYYEPDIINTERKKCDTISKD